jgi:hypothetical protein
LGLRQLWDCGRLLPLSLSSPLLSIKNCIVSDEIEEKHPQQAVGVKAAAGCRSPKQLAIRKSQDA